MNNILKKRKILLAGFVGSLLSLPLAALEIVTEQDFIEGVVTTEQLVRVVDNAVFLVDTSTSMNDKYANTGESMLDIVERVFKKRNSYLPNLGYNFGIYAYTPWKEYYAMQPYDRAKVAAALDSLPAKGNGPTPIKKGLEKLDDVLAPLSGRTAVFVFSDGTYTGGNPTKVARKLASKYDICFYVISTAKPGVNHTLQADVAALNACSRLIPFANFLNRPEYTTGALFDVQANEELVTFVETKVVGLETNDITFAFDKTELSADDESELDEIGQFMASKPGSFAVIAGYTDNVGPEDYNEGLSRRRAEIAASYLMDTHNIGSDRLVLHWYGSDNPLVSNDTREGRATNRRVEIAVGIL